MAESAVSGPLPQSTPLQSNTSSSTSTSSSSTSTSNHAPGTTTAPSGTDPGTTGPLNMADMRSALPGVHSYYHPHAHQHQQPMPQHMPQYAIPQPGLFYPVYPQYYPHQTPYPGFSPAYMQPAPSQMPMYAAAPAGYAPGYMPAAAPAGVAPYPMMAGHAPGYLSPGLQQPLQHQQPQQGFVHPGQYAKQSTRLRTDMSRRDSTKSGATGAAASPAVSVSVSASGSGSGSASQDKSEKSMTIVDGSTSMKSSDSRSEISPLPSLPPAIANTVPGAPRRTPRQSGHALWVGNLPPGTSIVDLKDHFSQGMSPDIESVFLISKSNCAFINYKTEEVCSTAQARFHDSRFQGVRLVCRLRRGAVPGSTASSSVGSMSGSSASASASASGGGSSSSSPVKSESPMSPAKASEPQPEMAVAAAAATDGVDLVPTERLPNRYFIVKSLTIEDLESSRQSGIWATQTHNEPTLNRAYDTADNVYLIFSANKSGEYYGYARMVSPIQEDEKLAKEMPARTNHIPPAGACNPPEPNVTLTPATATARSGRIIDDPARGTIFWEADTPDEDSLSTSSGDANGCPEGGDSVTASTEAANQTIGRPFRIQWLSTERVPFHRTRGLRNPWNANRGVKIARDGTEIEPTVGAQVVELFHLPLTGTSGSGYRLG